MASLLLVAMPFVPRSFLFLVVRPGATSSFLLLVAKVSPHSRKYMSSKF